MATTQYTQFNSPYIDQVQQMAGIGLDQGGGGGINQWHPESGSGAAQAAALRNPPAQNTSTPVNPMQSEAYGATKGSIGNSQTAFNTAADFQKGLAGQQNELINKQLASARDDISAGMRSEGIAAMSRGADPSLFKSRALQQGQQYLGKLQTGLTADALAAQNQAVGNLTGAANASTNATGNSASAANMAAGNQTNLQLGTLAAQSQAQRDADAAAAEQARLYQAPYDRLMGMMSSVAQNGGAFGATNGGGFTGPSGSTMANGGIQTVGFGRSPRSSFGGI